MSEITQGFSFTKAYRELPESMQIYRNCSKTDKLSNGFLHQLLLSTFICSSVLGKRYHTEGAQS